MCCLLLPACVLHYPVEDGQADMHTSPETSAEVRGAGEDVAQTLIPHELPASLLNQMLHLKDTSKLYFLLFHTHARTHTYKIELQQTTT